MNKNILLFSLLFIFLSCGTTKKVKYKVTNKEGENLTYQVRIPKGFKVKEADYEHERFKVFIYADSSSIFFSNDIYTGAFPPEAYIKYGQGIRLMFKSVDTITLDGVGDKGKLWKYRKATNVVFGYLQVPPEKKVMFDNLIDRISIKVE
ncbi:MAG: hypothetical protein ABIY35_09085 [Chitinophagaceae bacterium]